MHDWRNRTDFVEKFGDLLVSVPVIPWSTAVKAQHGPDREDKFQSLRELAQNSSTHSQIFDAYLLKSEAHSAATREFSEGLAVRHISREFESPLKSLTESQPAWNDDMRVASIGRHGNAQSTILCHIT